MDVPTFIWMFLVLKIPVAAALWLVWWAIQEPEPEAADDDGGSARRRRDPRPRGPRSPRRGPHGGLLPSPPARVRVTAVADRSTAGRHRVG